MKSNTIRGILFVIVLIGITAVIFFIYNNKEEEDYNHLKNYQVNEYIPTYVSDEDMIKIYVNDYLYYARNDILESYNLIDSEYKSKKFTSYESYYNYIINFASKNIKVDRYSRIAKGGYVYYVAYTNTGDTLVFKTKGVMQYSVYLDDDTIEIR